MVPPILRRGLTACINSRHNNTARKDSMSKTRRNFSFPTDIYRKLKEYADEHTMGNKSLALCLMIKDAWQAWKQGKGK